MTGGISWYNGEMKSTRKILTGLAVIEMLLLMAMAGPLIKPGESYTWDRETLVMPEGADFVETPRVHMKKGVYDFRVDYELRVLSDEESGEESSVTFFQDGIRGRALDVTHPHMLTFRQEHVTGRLILGDYEAAQTYAQVTRKGDVALNVRQISLSYLRGISILHELVKWLALVTLINLAAYAYLAPASRLRRFLSDHAIVIVLCLVSVFLACLPTFYEKLIEGHDLRFHVFRIRAIAQSLQNGDIAARIQPGWLDDYGYAVGAGYGQVMLYPSALLYLCGFSIETAYRFFVWIINLLSFCTAYLCGREITGNRTQAAVCACVYTLSFYRLTDVYFRAAAGEAGAMAFYPLIAAGLYVAYRGTERSAERRAVLYLTAGATGVLQTHIISVWLTIFGLIPFFLLFMRQTLKKRRVIAVFARSLGLSVLVNLWFLVPFADYIIRKMFYVVEERGGGFQAMAGITTPFHRLFLSHNDTIWMVFGSSAFLLAVICVVIAAGSVQSDDKRTMFKLAALLGVFLAACTEAVPYTWMMVHWGRVYKILSNIQFPWKFLAVCSVLLLVLVAYALRVISLKENGERLGTYRPVFLAGITFLGVLTGIQYMEAHLSDATAYTARDSFQSAFGMEFVLPYGYGEEELLQHGWPELPQEPMIQEVRLSEDLSATALARNTTQGEIAWDVPRLNYYGYRATGEHGALTVVDGPNRNVRVMIPPGYQGRVAVSFRQPWYWTAAGLISAAGVVWLLWRMRRSMIRKSGS